MQEGMELCDVVRETGFAIKKHALTPPDAPSGLGGMISF
jgi:hypothetical protein